MGDFRNDKAVAIPPINIECGEALGVDMSPPPATLAESRAAADDQASGARQSGPFVSPASNGPADPLA